MRSSRRARVAVSRAKSTCRCCNGNSANGSSGSEKRLTSGEFSGGFVLTCTLLYSTVLYSHGAEQIVVLYRTALNCRSYCAENCCAPEAKRLTSRTAPSRWTGPRRALYATLIYSILRYATLRETAAIAAAAQRLSERHLVAARLEEAGGSRVAVDEDGAEHSRVLTHLRAQRFDSERLDTRAEATRPPPNAERRRAERTGSAVCQCSAEHSERSARTISRSITFAPTPSPRSTTCGNLSPKGEERSERHKQLIIIAI